ncbi:phosphonate ABC transporter permease [Bacillus cytotoxicus]|uniref:Phosphonate ABC transporter permease n=1 Tax=Bacillus cytotoxicus TaxID=580165 RepID=A0ACC6A2H1_9BACI|nr:phosphonate ABC transporter permease [Bacillus cytotoxicus]HDX9579987.1 phosphonate ABC transporter permease [Bacillus pseudomycoides]
MPFLGSVYQVFGLYAEMYHAMVCMENKDTQSIGDDSSKDENETVEE